MNIWEADKLFLFVAFVIPGFISIKAYEILLPSQIRDSSKQVIDAIAYSCVNYAILYWPIISISSGSFHETHLFLFYFFFVFVLLLAPIIWVIIWKKLRESKYFQRNAPHPTQKPWDFVFAQNKCYWVKVTMKDGTMLGGKFADKSFASSAPAEEQIYLEETWVLDEDGAFERAKNRSEGVIILSSEISHVELRSYS